MTQILVELQSEYTSITHKQRRSEIARPCRVTPPLASPVLCASVFTLSLSLSLSLSLRVSVSILRVSTCVCLSLSYVRLPLSLSLSRARSLKIPLPELALGYPA